MHFLLKADLNVSLINFIVILLRLFIRIYFDISISLVNSNSTGWMELALESSALGPNLLTVFVLYFLL